MCNANRKGQGGSEGHCCPRGGRVHGFLQPWLLLSLSQKPAHGYELIEWLGQGDDIPAADPGLLYRTLRQFEAEGLVRSSWDTEKPGAPRRVYEITDEGIRHLHEWVANIRRTRARLDRFLREYQARFDRGQVEGTGEQSEDCLSRNPDRGGAVRSATADRAGDSDAPQKEL